jgi:hypothetical protein
MEIHMCLWDLHYSLQNPTHFVQVPQFLDLLLAYEEKVSSMHFYYVYLIFSRSFVKSVWHHHTIRPSLICQGFRNFIYFVDLVIVSF